MKICLAQIKSDKGNIKSNIKNHKKWIDIAIAENADVIVFPELSLTAYEPKLAMELATEQNDARLDDFQKTCDQHKITIGIGLPTKSESGISISMVIFQPNTSRKTYSKQILHSDEKPYFTEGSNEVVLEINKTKIALAICYESLQFEHGEKAKKSGADLYLASVAKSKGGIEKALTYFPETANTLSMPILMVNCIGYCDNFESAGQSSIWSENGTLIGQLDNKNEGLLLYDLVMKKTKKV